MKSHRVISLLASASLALSLTALPASAARFVDTAGHPAEALIDRYASLGIIKGVGNKQFQPDRALTRAELCVILDRLFSYKTMSDKTFADLEPGTWYYKPMLRLNAARVVFGDGGLIRPQDTVRWDEALTMLARAFGIRQLHGEELPFPAAGWAEGYIAALYTAGYLPEELPDLTAPFTRADTLVVLDNIVNGQGWSAAGKILFRDRLLPILESVPASRLDKDCFYREEDGRLYYYDDSLPPVTYGVDVSAYQKDVDWWAVANDGIDFAMLRIGGRGYGTAGNLYWDTYFEKNLEEARDAGLDVGIYFFSQAITVQEAEEEARLVLEHLDGRELEYPVVFDWETISGAAARTDGLDTATLTACARTFCRIIAEAGYLPMVYFNATNGLLNYDLSQLTDYPFWYAYYPSSTSTDPWLYYDFQMWQYTSSGSVAGIPGRADMNICFSPDWEDFSSGREDEWGNDPYDWEDEWEDDWEDNWEDNWEDFS